MAGVNNCKHEGELPDGICPTCKIVTCNIGKTNCRCAVGYPYELQCEECRDKKPRLDNGYCVCTPSKFPPRL